MTLFKKRTTPIQNIAYMAIMSAINVIFVLLSNILPVLLFLLVFLLPLTSTIVTIYCKKKYYPIYFIVTLSLCILVAYGFSIFDTLIYVLPALIIGFLFGIAFEYKLPAILIIVVNTVIEFFLSILTFFVLGKIVTNLNMMDTLINAFGLSEFGYKLAFTLIFLFVIAQIQIVLSYIFIKIELKRLGLEINLNSRYQFLLYILTFIFLGLSILSYFYFPDWTMVFVLMPLVIYIYQLLTLVLKRRMFNYISLGVSHLAFIFIFAFLYTFVTAPNQLILIYVLFGSVTIIDIFDNYCFHKK